MKRIKIHWGTAIVLAFMGFIAFILSFVIRMNTQKKYDHELVTEAYYAKELSFQRDMDREKFTVDTGMEPRIEATKGGIFIYFPEGIDPAKVSGKIGLYRPSDRTMDFEVPVQMTTSPVVLIPSEALLPGRWNVEVDWQYGDDTYLSHRKLVY
ncbi:FixH family protein [Sinomicrobium oceani]|uniref:FixH family protein n=1 Tax=Sinomicrobium oceani TaxID=1150368 RepID=UPI00227BFA06|nr:FixH family protein [Sinomicrobium oceani]